MLGFACTQTYEEGRADGVHVWVSWADWLGYGVGRPAVGACLAFDDARELARELELTTQRDWERWCRAGNRPQDVPSNPDRVRFQRLCAPSTKPVGWYLLIQIVRGLTMADCRLVCGTLDARRHTRMNEISSD
jgi:hypothetical protein